MTEEKEYVLGTDDAELSRLGLQHRVWRRRALESWLEAGFTAGSNLVDLGCGPGYATLDLAEMVGPSGSVLAIDQSSRFLHHLKQTAADRHLANIRTLEMDLNEDALPSMSADGVWVRWVFAFLRRRKELLSGIRGLLKVGGTLAVHEYLDYSTWRIVPQSNVFELFVSGVIRSWRDTGGEPDTGPELLNWLPEAGFRIQSARTIMDIVTPRDFTWQWPKAFVKTGADRLVELGYLSRADADEMGDLVARAERSPGGFMITPAVVQIVAVAI